VKATTSDSRYTAKDRVAIRFLPVNVLSAGGDDVNIFDSTGNMQAAVSI